MPYAKPSDVPSNVPEAYKAQFMEVFNSVHAAALQDKKSPAQADEKSFAQAYSVINNAKNAARDVSADGPGFGPVEKKFTDGGQAEDPTQPLRDRSKIGTFSNKTEDQKMDGMVCSACGGDVTNREHGTGESSCCKASIVPVESAHPPASITNRPAAKFDRKLSHLSETREKYMSVEKRYAAELRVGTANEAGGMSLVGYAARFNSPSKDLGGFKEIIAPGAFTRALAANSDVRCLFNHDANKVLGRTLSGTLKLTQDDNGLMFHCTLDPNNTEHRNLHSSVARGDINECSFAFTANGENGDHWEDKQDADGKYFISRTLKDVNLFDVSAVTNPAYSNTSVQARDAEITPEIRSIMSEIVKKRAAKVGGIEARSESVQEMLNCMSKCLAEQFPRTDQTDTSLPVSWGQYYMCDTYDTYIIACQEGPGCEYVSISFVEKPDGEGFIFGTPVPVEKEWIPSDRCKSVLAEFRAMTSSHMQAIAEQHAKAAAAHTDTAAAHTDAATAHTDAAEAHSKAAADAQQVAERMEKCSATMGDCSTKGCECQNRMIATRDMDDSYEDYLNIFGDDDGDERTAKIVAHRAARKSVAAASDEPMTRCKVVGGSNLPAGAFAHVGDPDETRTWKNAVHDAAHTTNSMAADRSAVPADKADAVTAKIQRAAKKFGIQSEAEKAAAVAARAAAEKEDLELRFRLAMAL
jgi:hypothetical protein